MAIDGFSSAQDGIQVEYKKYYTLIFSLFYLFEGFHQSIPATAAYYILTFQPDYDVVALGYIAGINTLPWSIKFIVGMINDKWGSKKYGQRFPFIIFFGSWCGLFWIIEGIFLPANGSIYMYLFIFGLMTNIGMAFADTAIDGLILDVTPKNKLARLQAYTWTFLLIGGGIGAIGLGILLVIIMKMAWLLLVITGAMIILVSIFPYWIKEPPLKPNINIKDDLKRLVLDRKNWKIYVYTFTDRIAGVILGFLYGYLVMLGLGVISVEETLVSLKGGQLLDLVGITVILTFVGGIGTSLGSLIIGNIADKGRKKAIYIAFGIHFIICIASNVLYGPGVTGWVLAISGYLIFGIAGGGLSTTGQTIRGDYARREFPKLKSTFYALLVSFSNGGLAFSNFMASYIFAFLASLFNNFNEIYFIVSIISLAILFLSFTIFKSIDPKDYEFNELLGLKEKTKNNNNKGNVFKK
ncbi:MAG: MFS transporter [Promethearchaeota archaeon]